MAEENGPIDPNAVRDPFRRQLLTNLSTSQAENGTAPELITNAPTGDPLSTGAGGSEFTSSDTGIRESILAGARGAFEEDLATVQSNAERRRQMRSGVTSQEELRAARIGQQRRIGLLGQFEAGERADVRRVLSEQAISERAGETATGVAGIQAGATTGAAGIRAKAATDVADIQKQIASGQNVSAETIAKLNKDIAAAHDLSAEKVAGIQKDIAAAGNQSDKDIAAANNVSEQAVADIRAASDLANLAAQGREDRATQEPRLLLDRQKETGKITGSNQASMNDVKLAVFGEDGNTLNTELATALVGADVLKALATKYTPIVLEDGTIQGGELDEDGNPTGEFDAVAFNADVLQMAFTAAIRDPNAYAAAAGIDDIATSIPYENMQIKKAELALAERAQIFNEGIATATLTGIYKVYGPEELEAFVAAFGTVAGQEGYDARYDFNGDGKIDFDEDFLAFSAAVELGGVPTLAYKETMRLGKEFDITQANSIQALRDQIDAIAQENGFDRDQELTLTLKALEQNLALTNAGINVEEMAILVEILNGDAADFMDDPTVISLVETIMEKGDINKQLRLENGWDAATDHRARTVQERFIDYENDDDANDFLGIKDVHSVSDWYNVAVADLNADRVGKDTRDSWIQLMDIDGDGYITLLDKYAYFQVGE